MDTPSPLRTAGNGLRSLSSRVMGSSVTGSIVNGANKAVTAARGLRMPGMGAVTSAAAPVEPVVAPAPAAAPIDPVVAPTPAAAPAAPAVDRAALGLRAAPTPIADTIPTLTDVIKPGNPLYAKMPVNPNVGPGMMSAEAAAAGYGSATVPKPPAGWVPPPDAAPAAAAAEAAPAAAKEAGLLARGLRAASPALNVLGKASAVGGVGMGAYNAATGAMEGDGTKAALGAADAGASAALLTPAAPAAATYLGIRAGSGLINASLSDQAKDAIGGTINNVVRGLAPIAHRAGEIIVGKSGPFTPGPANWGQDWGVDDNNYLRDNGAPTPLPVKTGAAAAGVPAAPLADDDITKFNARMQRIGAPSVGMRAGDGGPDSRELFNSAPASADAVRAGEAYQAQRTGLQAGADAANGRMLERQQADAKMAAITGQRFDESAQGQRFDNALTSASTPRIGASPFGTTAQLTADRAAAQKDFEVSKGLRAQGVVAMRGQDTTSDDARLQQQTAMANGMRAQANSNFEHQLALRKNGQEQDKISMEQRSKAEADLTSRLNTMFVGPDGKPDAARVGDAVQKMNAEIGRRIQQAQAVPKDSPHFAEAQQIADELSKKGVAALDPADHKKLLSLLAVRDRQKQVHGPFTPGGAEFVDSDLGGYQVDGVENNLIGSPTLHMANGGSMRQNDVRYTDPANTILPDVKVATDMYDAGLGMRAGAKGKK